METVVQTANKRAEPPVAERAHDRFRTLEKDTFDVIVVGAETVG